MKRKLLLIHCLILLAVAVRGQSVVINKLFNNTNTSADYGGGVNGQGDAVELLVLEDGTDLRGAYIKDLLNINTAPAGLKEGGIWQFSTNALWSNLKAGTTIQLVRPPINTAVDRQPVLDVNPSDNHLLIPLAAASSDYLIGHPSILSPSTTYFFNLQGSEGVILKRGTTPYGTDNIIHMLVTGYGNSADEVKAGFDAVTENKVVTNNTLTGTSANNGVMFFKNPTAANNPENGLADYLGLDDDASRDIIGWVTDNTVTPAWGVGEAASGVFNKKFIDYLRVAPKIVSITPVTTPSASPSVVFNVVFDKPVTFSSTAGFDVEVTGSALGTVASVSTGTSTTHQVTVSNLSGQGTIKLIKTALAVDIADADNNKLFNGFVWNKGTSHRVDNVIAHVSGIPAGAKSVVVNKMFNSGATADDVVELLVLEDHVDLNNVFIKDQAGNTSASTTYNDGGGKYQFKDIAVWQNLRSGTTIVLRKSPSAGSGYVIDADASDGTLDISLDDARYFTNISGTFNLQNYDMVVLKGGTTATGYDNLIHAFISGVNTNTKSVFDAFPEPKMGINALIPTTNGFLYANSPTAATAPHLGAADYSGFVNTDKPGTVTPGTTVVYSPENPIAKTSFNSVVPAYHLGETGTNRAFIDYLRVAPKVERIVPAERQGKESSVSFFVFFNRAVTGVDISDFRLLATNTANGAISSVTGSGSSYEIVVTNLSGKGNITIIKNASSTGITDGTNMFFEGFEYLKCNPYYVDDLPEAVYVPEAPVVVGVVNGLTDNFRPTIRGYVRSGAQVNLYVDDVLVNSTITSNNSTGEWLYTFTEPLSIGTHNFYINTGSPGASAGKSAATTVKFAIKVPVGPAVREAVDGVTNSLMPTITGSADPNSIIRLYMDDMRTGPDILVDASGLWSYYLQEGLEVGEHRFHVTATTDIGTSEKSATTTVMFKLFSGTITVPNILTPNGDGKNDLWVIDNLSMYPHNEVLVFDKVGKVVYRQQNYQQNWDGTSEGRELNSGTYYYQVSFGPDLSPLKGYITILRSK